MIPLRTMQPISTWPEPKTVALGGVATGIMKAREAEIVAGSMGSSGLNCSALTGRARYVTLNGSQ